LGKYEVDPWPGYTEQTDEQRLDTLEHKIGEARRRGDLLYGIAVCSAVAACEALRRGDGEVGDLERTATTVGNQIHDYGADHIGDAGGWTPK
jgi:hypothetical protein